jgi:hypothetical protein
MSFTAFSVDDARRVKRTIFVSRISRIRNEDTFPLLSVSVMRVAVNCTSSLRKALHARLPRTTTTARDFYTFLV